MGEGEVMEGREERGKMLMMWTVSREEEAGGEDFGAVRFSCCEWLVFSRSDASSPCAG